MPTTQAADRIGDLWRLYLRQAKGAGVIPRFADGLAESGYDKVAVDFLLGLAADFADFSFRTGSKFAFRPPKTVTIGPYEPGFRLLALHEVGHAVCGHRDFKTDPRRLKMEVEAWEKARELADKYCVQFDEELMQDELDTYREWLHKKSRCPKCGLTRFETPNGQYHCPRCENFCVKSDF